MTSRRVLDIGCGHDKLPGAIGVDANLRSGADIIHNLDERPWPFEDNSFDYIRAQNVLEHVADFVGVMEELHRVACANALIEVRMPFMSSSNFATDPTHRRAATSRTFDYFDPKKSLSSYAYSPAQFEVVEWRYLRGYEGDIGSVFRVLDRGLLPFIHRHASTYELYFAHIYPMHDLSYLLRTIK